MDSLPLFHRISGQPVIVLGEGEAADAKRRLVERAGGIVVGAENTEAKLAFVALGDPEVAIRCLIGCHVLVNVPDRPELCDFTVPSILDRTPVLVAIGTGGASAGLAKALRLRLETLLPPGIAALARGLGAAREAMRARWPDAGERRRALDAALGQGGALDPLGEGSGERVGDWLAGDDAGIAAGLHEVHLRSADPDELTLREARLLGAADLIAFESNVPPAVIARARADAQRLVLHPGGEAPKAAGLTVLLRNPVGFS